MVSSNRFAGIASDSNISFLPQMVGGWPLGIRGGRPVQNGWVSLVRWSSLLNLLGERAVVRGQWDSTTTGATPVLAPLGIALWSIRHAVGGRSRSKRYSTAQISPCGVLSTTKVNGLDREVTPPRGVSTSTEIVDFDRDFTPRGEICHLQSHRACSVAWIWEDLDISSGLGY